MIITNPATGQSSEFEETPVEDLERVFRAAAERFKTWSRLPAAERTALLAPVLQHIEQSREQLARAAAEEMGKPIVFARVELDRTIAEFHYMLNAAEKALAPQEADHGKIAIEPLGVTAVISPWNFPFLLSLRSIVAALITGNSVIFKPSELSPRCGALIAGLFENEMTESPLFSVYGGKQLGAAVVRLPVRAVCFTGSSAVGKAIAAESASSLKRVILELGGIDAAIVLEDADIEASAKKIVARNSANSGQVCNAVKRVYVPKSRYETFVEAAANASRAIKIGDPLEESTEMGPIVSGTQLDRVAGYITDAVQQGAKVVSGGKRLPRSGFFLEHTVLTEVPAQARLLREEAFGPVLPIMPYSTVESAIALANDTDYGLTASLWTSNQEEALRLAPFLEVGTVSINDHVAGGPGTPWGGAKSSGIGRMKTAESLKELCNIKYIRLP